ncbi:MAG: nitrogenase component 1 [Myxococcota bacterium]
MRFRPHKMYPGALLAQECCNYQAMTELLARIRGRMVVLIHSDRDCSNVLPKAAHWARSDFEYKFLCTNLREDEIVTGQGNSKLRRSIEIVQEAWAPDLIVVLSTCPTVMVGDNIANVSRRANEESGARVAWRITHGLKPKSPAEVVDDCYSMLCSQAAAPEGSVEGRVNLVGVRAEPAEREEIESVLAELGVDVNVVLDDNASLQDYLAVRNAEINVHPGPNMLLSFDEMCEGDFGMRTVEVPLPFGLKATDTFYRSIAEAVGVSAAHIDAVLGRRRREGAEAVAGFRERFAEPIASRRGLRCAYNIGSVRTFDLRLLAQEELGQKSMMEELGFRNVLHIQGPADETNQERVAGVLKEMGCEDPFTIFADPGQLERIVEPGSFDVFLGTEFMQNQLARLGLPLVQHRMTTMGYHGVPHNVALVESALRDRFYRIFGDQGAHGRV